MCVSPAASPATLRVIRRRRRRAAGAGRSRVRRAGSPGGRARRPRSPAGRRSSPIAGVLPSTSASTIASRTDASRALRRCASELGEPVRRGDRAAEGAEVLGGEVAAVRNRMSSFTSTGPSGRMRRPNSCAYRRDTRGGPPCRGRTPRATGRRARGPARCRPSRGTAAAPRRALEPGVRTSSVVGPGCGPSRATPPARCGWRPGRACGSRREHALAEQSLEPEVAPDAPPRARERLGERGHPQELLHVLLLAPPGWYRYWRRPAASTPTARMCAFGASAIQTSSHAGGIARSAIRFRSTDRPACRRRDGT